MRTIEAHWSRPIDKLDCSDDALRDTFDAVKPEPLVTEGGGPVVAPLRFKDLIEAVEPPRF